MFLQTTNMLKLYCSLGLILNLKLSQHCSYALVRFRYKKHSVRVRNTSCFVLTNMAGKYLDVSPVNTQSFFTYKC